MPTDSLPGTNRFRYLTDRDREILDLLGQNGVAVLEQLWVKFWPVGTQLRTCRDRLYKLNRAGYVSHDFIAVRGRRRGEMAFYLTDQGAKEFTPFHRANFAGKPSPHELRQQLLALDARIIIEDWLHGQKYELVQWEAERLIRSQAISTQLAERKASHKKFEELGKLKIGEIPDARFVIQPRNSHPPQPEEIYLEIDGRYAGQALTAKLESLGNLSQRTWYVAEAARGRAQKVNEALGKCSEAARQKVAVLAVDYSSPLFRGYMVNR